MAKQSSSSTDSFDDFEAEFEAAMTLLELPRLISESESRSRFSFTWGAKRKRSSPDETTALTLSSFSPPSVPEITVVVATAAVGPTPPSETTTEKEKPKALSPATPLLFPPSESDEKPKPQNPTRKVNFKRKKEEYLNMVEELTESNKIFKEEIKILKSYYNQEKALNLKLKAMDERIKHGLQKEQPQQTQLSLNHTMELAQRTVQFDIQDQPQQSQYMVHQLPFIMDQTPHNSESSQYPYGQNISLSSNSGLFMINDNKVGPSVPLDLNVSLEESFMMESSQGFNVAVASKSETKALAAQARQRRIQICRSKNSKAASQLRYPVCR